MKKIFFIHRGNSDYVSSCLKQCSKFKDKYEIILLGDKLNNCYNFVKHELIENYYTEAKEFEKIYKHLSPNNREYEVFCFSRWFVLREYMRKNNIYEGCYLDTDVMLMKEFPEDLFDDKFNYTFDSGHTSIFNIKILDEFCKYIINYYSNNMLVSELERIYKLKQVTKANEGISDMTLISLFSFDYENKCRDLSIIRNKMICDHNINCSDGYEMVSNKKKIYSINNNLYVRNARVSKFVEISTIHFQGRAKIYMNSFNDLNIPEDSYFDYLTGEWKCIDVNKIEKENSHTFFIKLKELKYKIKDKLYLKSNKIY